MIAGPIRWWVAAVLVAGVAGAVASPAGAADGAGPRKSIFDFDDDVTPRPP